jgi:hypothetical protein
MSTAADGAVVPADQVTGALPPESDQPATDQLTLF